MHACALQRSLCFPMLQRVDSFPRSESDTKLEISGEAGHHIHADVTTVITVLWLKLELG